MRSSRNRFLGALSSAILLSILLFSGTANASGAGTGDGLGTLIVGIFGLTAGLVTAISACILRLRTGHAFTLLPIVFFAVMCVVPFLFYGSAGISNGFSGTVQFFQDSFRTFEVAAQTMLVASISLTITFVPLMIFCAIAKQKESN